MNGTQMDSLGDAISKIMDKWLMPVGECPVCKDGTQMLVWKGTDRDGGLRCPPVCPKCKYSEHLIKGMTMTDLDATIAARKNKARDYLRKSSVVSAKSIFKRTFGNYQAVNNGEKQALEFSRKIADRIVAGQTIHAMLIGPTGTGKTHLAMGIVYNVLARTNYAKKVNFVDWREYLNLLKVGMHDNSKDVQTYTDFLRKELTSSDILVLDDIGAERGTEFDISEADSFWRLREDKTVITTTNLNTRELKAHYGNRTVSRMHPHSRNAIFVMSGIEDHRGGKYDD